MKKSSKNYNNIDLPSMMGVILGMTEVTSDLEQKPFWKVMLIVAGRMLAFVAKVRVSEKQVQILKDIDRKMMLGNGCVMMLANCKFEREVKRNYFTGKEKVVYYLIAVDMWMFNKKSGFWGTVMKPPLYFIANNDDFVERVQQWTDIKHSLEVAGYSITPSVFAHNDYY